MGSGIMLNNDQKNALERISQMIYLMMILLILFKIG